MTVGMVSPYLYAASNPTSVSKSLSLVFVASLKYPSLELTACK